MMDEGTDTDTAQGAPRLKRMGWESDESPRSLRRLASLVVAAIRLLWEATPRLLVLMVVLEITTAAAAAVSLLIVRDLVTRALELQQTHGAFGAIVPELVLLALALGLAGMASSVQNSVRLLMSERVEWLASEKVLDVACGVELDAFDAPGFHDLVQRAQNAGGRPYMVTQGLLSLGGAAAGALGLLGVLLVINPLLVPALLVGVIPLVLVAMLFGQEFHELSVRFTQDQRRRLYVRSLLTSREMAKEVRAFGLIEHFRGLNRRLFEERVADLRRLAGRGAGRSLLGSAGTAASVGATIGVLFWFVLARGMSFGAASAAAVAIVQLGSMLTGMAVNAGQLYEGSLFLGDHQVFRDRLPSLERALPSGPAPERFDLIRVEDLAFTYPGSTRPALDGVSLELRRGEVVALVGENGSGKTTLAKLLSQLYQPSSGRIWWDATDLATVDPRQLRRSVAVVFQDFPQYLLSAGANIGLGRVEALSDQGRIEAAAGQAGAHEFLEQLPQGYRTMLGRIFEDGVDLSIGQWQRVALARAFFRDAPLVILDEPTAALDARAEHDLFESIRGLFVGRTVLLISHRFSSVVSADRVFVLRNGRLIEQGTHAQLMAGADHYAELFRLQAAAYLEASET
jgi:ATP-binding cassette subfamily B protein